MKGLIKYPFLVFVVFLLLETTGISQSNTNPSCSKATISNNIQSILQNSPEDYSSKQINDLLNLSECFNKLNLPSVTVTLLTDKRFKPITEKLSIEQKTELYYQLAYAWRQTGHYNKAKQFYKKVISLQDKGADTEKILEAGFNLIELFLDQNLPYKAELYLNLIENLTQTNPRQKDLKCRILLAKADILKSENDLQKAIRIHQYAIDSLTDCNSTFKVSHFIKLASIYTSLNNTQLSEKLLNETGSDSLLKPDDYYMAKSELYRAVGDNKKATFYFQKYLEAAKQGITEFSYKRDAALSENSDFMNLLALLKPEKEKEFSSGSLILLIFVILLFIILAILTVIIYSQQKQLKKRKTELKKIENTKKLLIKEEHRLSGIEKEEIHTRLEKLQAEAKSKESAIEELKSKIEESKNLEKQRHTVNLDLGFHIRSLLSSILGFTSVFKTEFARLREKELYQYADIIEENANLIMTMVDSYHEYTNIAAGKVTAQITKVDAPKIIEQVVNELTPLAKQKNIKLVFNPKKVPLIIADEELTYKIIKQATVVALNNTVKGFVIIDIDLIKNNKFCEIKIQNTGHGFDEAYLKDILEPFNRDGLNYIPGFTGTGMEYPLINKLARLMKAKVSVDAKIEQGITFTLTVPASAIYPKKKEDKPLPTPKEQVDKLPWEGLKVLVVEDDIMNRLLFSKILKKAAKLTIAEDGNKGLEAVGDLFKEGETFDLVLMDINLPDNWDGVMLKNRIQELFSPYRKIPFIAQTAYAMQGDREMFLSEGFDEYISKPIIKKELIRVVLKALDKSKI